MTLLNKVMASWVVGLTITALCVSAFFPAVTQSITPAVAFFLIVFLGIPHGATDHLLYDRLLAKKASGASQLRFYAFYLVLMIAYGLLWWVAPWPAFAFFLFTSAYHFGESEWFFLSEVEGWWQTLTYLSWGSFVIAAPVCWHFEEASGIISSILRQPIAVSVPMLSGIPLLLLAGNLVLISGLWWKQAIDRRQYIRQLFYLLLLAGLFYQAPLLLSFSVYFAAWHSLSSGHHQIIFQRRRQEGHYSWRSFVRDALPYTLLAVVGLGVMMLWYVRLDSWFTPAAWGYLFLFISVITLPHTVLMHYLYDSEALAASPKPQLTKD